MRECEKVSDDDLLKALQNAYLRGEMVMVEVGRKWSSPVVTKVENVAMKRDASGIAK